MLFLHQTFLGTVEEAEAGGALRGPALSVLRRVAELHGVAVLGEAAGDLLEGGYLSGQQAAWLRSARRGLVRALRPDAVALADAFGHEDYLLNSALGRRDGDVYRSLLGMAQGSPLNATPEGPAWAPVLQKLLDPGARRSKL